MEIDRRLLLRRVAQATSVGGLIVLPALGRPGLVTGAVSAARPGDGSAPSSAAPVAVAAPAIVSRSSWQAPAQPPTQAPTVQYDRVVRVAFVHHTDNPNSYAPQDVPEILREIHHDHLENRGWDDIGYNFLVDRFGTIYEGRAGGVDRPVVGAHTVGFNRETVGIAAIGTFDDAEVPEALVAATSALVAWRLGLCGSDPGGRYDLTSTNGDSRFPAGTRHTFNAVSGHRDAFCTTCPGEALYALLPRIAERAAAIQRQADASQARTDWQPLAPHRSATGPSAGQSRWTPRLPGRAR
ncbi:peptidoglycan recognition protein family protein [Kitasatospora viridis]|uniref:N-acetylmuramoyl-L-alanine amidase n=1 Tax=Kitasatospora viridis TaxID=281105 RepID=A0A561SEV5_9ACTN|nr:peptidoglycan recognition protein [Kitasatospora viridis]TWF73378.1 N-acetylmuramoyl-L-alanine amidase [Kitasatospora viridis]